MLYVGAVQDKPWYQALQREPVRNKPCGRGSDHVANLKKGELFWVIGQTIVRMAVPAKSFSNFTISVHDDSQDDKGKRRLQIELPKNSRKGWIRHMDQNGNITAEIYCPECQRCAYFDMIALQLASVRLYSATSTGL